MLGRDAVNDDAPWFWSDQYGQNLQLVGNRSASDDVVIRGSLDDLDFTAFHLDGGTICGAFSIDRGEDVMAVRELLGRAIDPAVLTDEDTDLWDLLDTEDPVEVVA